MKKKLLLFIFIFVSASFVFAAPNYTYSTPKTYDYEKNTNLSPEQEKILFIVDFSNSMNEKIGHNTKLEIALSTMQDILQMIPATHGIDFIASTFPLRTVTPSSNM